MYCAAVSWPVGQSAGRLAAQPSNKSGRAASVPPLGGSLSPPPPPCPTLTDRHGSGEAAASGAERRTGPTGPFRWTAQEGPRPAEAARGGQAEAAEGMRGGDARTGLHWPRARGSIGQDAACAWLRSRPRAQWAWWRGGDEGACSCVLLVCVRAD